MKLPLTHKVGIFLLISLLASLANISYATNNTINPTIYLQPIHSEENLTTYQIILTHNTHLLNVIEFTLKFDPSLTTITDTNISSPLCRPELIVANKIDIENGEWYVACGTFIPFMDSSSVLATITITHPAIKYSWLQFGEDTSLFLHDGFGTKITPTTLPWLHNYQLII